MKNRRKDGTLEFGGISLIRNGITLLIAAMVYTASYYIFHPLFQLLPGELWGRADFKLKIVGYELSFYDFVHFALGLIFYAYGAIRLVGITIQNHAAQDRETRKPLRLLTDGYYERVRHSMYGTFMLLSLGLLFPYRSLIGLTLLIVFIMIQYINGIIEERKVLSVLFEKGYQEYSGKVKAKYLTPALKSCFVSAGLFTIAGIIFI